MAFLSAVLGERTTTSLRNAIAGLALVISQEYHTHTKWRLAYLC